MNDCLVTLTSTWNPIGGYSFCPMWRHLEECYASIFLQGWPISIALVIYPFFSGGEVSLWTVKIGVQEVVRVFFHGELNVWMIAVWLLRWIVRRFVYFLLVKQSSICRSWNGKLCGVTLTSSSTCSLQMLTRVRDNGFSILHPSTCLYNFSIKLNTVLTL